MQRHFSGVDELLALRLDPDRLGDVHMVEEDTAGSGQAFPHVYGAIPVAAVEAVLTVRGAEQRP